MKLTPRWYQQEAHDAAIAWVRKCYDPCLLECPTGSGKSIIVAMIAKTIHGMSGKKILCLAPSSELVMQNREKYLLMGEPASVFSASAGRKETKNFVVFGSPLTVANNLNKFGSQYAAVIIDEAHGLSPTLLNIINHMRSQNPKLRIIGLSATPYRLTTGYIYQHHYKTGALTEDEAVDPFFTALVYTIDARMLIAEGYLSQPIFSSNLENYDTSGLTLNRLGQFSSDSVDRAFVGQGRKTSRIIADVVDRSVDKKGVMIFAATVQHAKEIMESLPGELSALVTGDTKKDERARIIDQFKKQQIKYIVNVSVLTTGFDAPHVDHIAILRATESVALLQQIIGRGLRVTDTKKECLISDYAQNIERHCPHGDVFDPDIKASRKHESAPINVPCPICSNVNTFALRKNDDGFEIDAEGFFIDAAGNRIETEVEGVFMPAHYGRRCQGFKVSKGHAEQCSYKWAFKTCDACGHENDIAARYCGKCKAEIVDPNEKLLLEAIKLEKDPYRVRIANVQMWRFKRWPGKDGKPDSLRVEYMIDEKPSTLLEWYHPESANTWLFNRWQSFCMKSFGEALPDLQSALDMQHDAAQPEKIAFKKKANSKYFDIVGLEWSKQE